MWIVIVIIYKHIYGYASFFVRSFFPVGKPGYLFNLTKKKRRVNVCLLYGVRLLKQIDLGGFQKNDIQFNTELI